MEKDQRGPLKKTVEVVVDAGMAAAATAIISPGGAAALVAGRAGLAAITTAFTAYRTHRAEAWWTEYVRRRGSMTPEEAATEAQMQSERDPQFRERVYHALQAVWNAVDECVLPCLASLAAYYAASGAPVDLTYKHFARFLQDSTRAEVELLRIMVELAARAFNSTHPVDVEAFKKMRTPKLQLQLKRPPVPRNPPIDDSETIRAYIPTDPPPDTSPPDPERVHEVVVHGGSERLLRRILANELANDPIASYATEAIASVTISRDQLENLSRFIAQPYTDSDTIEQP